MKMPRPRRSCSIFENQGSIWFGHGEYVASNESAVGMLDQKPPDGLRLMGRQLRRDHVSLSSLRPAGHDFAQEFDQGGTRVPVHRLAEPFARLGIERGKQQERTAPVVLMPLGAATRERQATRDRNARGPECQFSSPASESPARGAYPPLGF